MATETWTRGKLLTAKTYWRYRYSNGTWTDWSSYVNNSSTTGSSDLITSERAILNKIRVPVGEKVIKRNGYTEIRKVFKTLRQKGHLSKPNPCYITKRSASGADAETPILALPGGQGIQYKGQLIDSLIGIPPLVTYNAGNLQKGVESQLYQMASKADFDTVTQVGELLETVQMLRNPLTSLRSAAESLHQALYKKTRRLKGKELQEAISGTWLEYAFGLAPLLFGTAEIASNLVDALYPSAGRYSKISAHRQQEITKSITEQWYPLMPGYPGETLLRVERVEDVWVRGGMWLGAGKKDMTVGARLGLTSARQIVSNLYALMPLSFAVDWFVGIGPLLQECVPPRGKILSSYMTTGLTHKEDRHLLAFRAYWPLFPEIKSVFSGTAMSSSMTRTLGVTPPGSLQWGSGFQSLSQALNGAALAAGPITSLWSKLPWH